MYFNYRTSNHYFNYAVQGALESARFFNFRIPICLMKRQQENAVHKLYHKKTYSLRLVLEMFGNDRSVFVNPVVSRRILVYLYQLNYAK